MILYHDLYQRLIATKATALQEAQSRLRDAHGETTKEIVKEERQLDNLDRKLRETQKGTEEFKKIKNDIVSQYGKYFNGLDAEIERVGNLSTAYDTLSEAIRRSVAERKFEDFNIKEQENLDKVIGENLNKAYKSLMKNPDKEKGKELYQSFYNAAIRGEALSKEDETALKQSGMWSLSGQTYQYLRNIQDAKAATKTVLDDFKEIYQISGNNAPIDIYLPEDKSKKNTYADDYKTAKDDWEKSKKELQAIEKDKSKFSSDQYKAAKEKEKSAKENFESFGGKTKIDKSSNNSVEKRLEALRKLDEEDRKRQIEKQKFDLSLEQKHLENLEDSFEKQQTQNELNYRKELLSIQEHESEKLKAQREYAKDKYVSVKGDDKGFEDYWKKQTSADLSKVMPKGLRPEDIQEDVKRLTDAAQSAWENADKQSYNSEQERIKSLLGKYQDYNAKRISIEKEFNKELEKLNKLDSGAEKDSAIAQLEKDRKKAIKEVNEEESNELRKTSDLFVRLFADASQKSVREIKKVITETQNLYDYLKNTNSNDIVESFGFTAEQLRTLKEQPEQLKAIQDAVKSLTCELGNRSPFQAFSVSMENAIKKIKKGLQGDEVDENGNVIASGAENIISGIEGIGSSIDALMPTLDKFAEDMSAIFGEGTGDFLKGLNIAIGSVANIGSGAAKIIGGDLSGVLDVAKGVASFFGNSKKVNKEHQEALRLLQLQREQLEHIYKLEQ